jgi:hypothetical protein
MQFIWHGGGVKTPGKVRCVCVCVEEKVIYD